MKIDGKALWCENKLPKTSDLYLSEMGEDKIAAARAFHQSFPEYSPTPLVPLQDMSRLLNLGAVYIKDESYRFGLNAFKVLGGSFAIAKFVEKQLSRPVDFPFLTSEEFKSSFSPMTFFTATDGNHGRGVAWAAKRLGQKAVVLMPKGSSKARFDNIAALGAAVTIENLNYDDCVRKAAALSAQTPGSVVIQDTAWEGYEEIPTYIMQGYGTLISEAVDEFLQKEKTPPTHVFVQAGVGSLAAAVCGYLVNRFGKNAPRLIVTECRAADCFYRSANAADATAQAVSGDLNSIMAGLCCGEVNTIAWDILKNHAAAFVSCEDEISALGMRLLSSPLKGDSRVISGESGAVGMGLLYLACQNAALSEFKKAIGLNGHSKVLLISTEGDTDPERYREIVWNGAYSL